MVYIKYVMSFWIWVSLFLLGSCNQEDDIDAIFAGGQTWHWSASYTTSNWKDDNNATDVLTRDQKKEITQSAEKYIIRFDKDGTFKGKGASVSFNGHWSADGKKGTFSLVMESGNLSLSGLDKIFYDDLQAAQYYKGDSKNYIKLINGSRNRFIQFYVVE